MNTFDEPPPGKFFQVSIPVRFGDTDPYGVVYFASYFRYCHHGMEAFFEHVGLSPREVFRNREEGFGLPIAGASCDFFKPVRYGDTLQLAVFIIQAKSRSLTFGFHFYKGDPGELTARGQLTTVAINREWQSRSLPERIHQALMPYLPPVQGS